MGLIYLLSQDPSLFILIVISLVFALCVHEFSHGIVAYLCGDDTAYNAGRLTLNPMNHLDPIGSILILIIGVGYAKPVPVNSFNLKNPRIDMIKIAAAGPLSNFALSFLGAFFLVLFIKVNLLTADLMMFFRYFILINIYLGLFNLIPIHPLDGGQIFGNLISKYNPNIFNQLRTRGPIVLFAIIFLGLISGVSIIGLLIGYPAQLIFNFFLKIAELILFLL
tara:strand:+ start:1186 stop:1851 length:666 start_codon:yes stop_codon:yes gene_type:complete